MWLTNFLSEIQSLSNHDDETQFRILSVKPIWSLSAFLIIDDRSLFNYEQWWMGNSLSGLSHVISISIWVQHVQQHKVALIVHFSGFASSCWWVTRNEMDWSVFYFSMRHLPKPFSISCQWQPQVHSSLKHTFVAADVCVVTTRLIWMARAWDLTLSNSDLLGTDWLNRKVRLL